MMNKRILIISWHFPPGKSSTGINFFKNLKDSGYTFDVLHMGENTNPNGNMSLFEGAKSTFNLIGASNSDLSPFEPDGRKNFIRFCQTAARDLLKTNHYTAIVSQCAEFVSHIAAAEIKKEFPELPWLAWYCDLQTGNPYQDYYNRPSDVEDNKLEKDLLELCDAIIVTNEFQKDSMLKNFSLPEDKFHIIPHCFDPRFLREKLYTNEKFVFAHIGMLYKHKRSATPFIKAIKYLLQTWPEYHDKFQFKFIGSKDQDISDFIIADDGLHAIYIPHVSYEKSLQLMTEADALLLRDADFSGEGLDASPFYPGKLVDYLATGKPVIAVTMQKGFTADCLQQHKNARWATENNIACLARYFKDAIDGKIEKPDYCLNDTTFYNGALFSSIVEKYERKKQLLFVSHNFTNSKIFISWLRNNTDYEVILDHGSNTDLTSDTDKQKLLDNADIIFCEDNLAIASWYAENKKQGQKLIVRMPAQESCPEEINDNLLENTDYFITSTPHSYGYALKKQNLPISRIRMIPYAIDIRIVDSEIPLPDHARVKNIGLINYAQPDQRLELVLDIFEKLWCSDNSYELHLKGKSFIEIMNQSETDYNMDYYLKIRSKLAAMPCSCNIFFEDTNYNKMEFYSRMGYLLSLKENCADTLLLEQAMATGCIPLLMNNDRYETLFPQAFVFRKLKDIESFVLNEGQWQNRSKIKDYAKERFCVDKIAPEIIKLFEF